MNTSELNNQNRPVSTSFLAQCTTIAFTKCMKQDAPPNAARQSTSRLSLPPSLLAVLVLPWLAVSMPVNATGGSDKKDSVTVAQGRSQEVSTGQPAGDFVLSEKKGLLSLKAVGVELVQVLTALSRASGVPIILIDDAGAREKITIAFQGKTIQAAVREVMSTFSAGGLASVGGGNGAKQTLYVATKEGAESFRNKTGAMIDRIKQGERPSPVEVREWLLKVAGVGFAMDNQGTGLFILPVLLLLNRDYATYEASVSSLFRDQSVVSPLRSAMLELIGRHWDYAGSRDSLLIVFDRSGDDGILQGQIALTLAGRGVTIGDAVIDRYSTASPEARFYYAQALATLGRTDAIPLLLNDTEQTYNAALRDVAISSLIKLDPCSPQTASVVNSAIHSAKAVPMVKQTANTLYDEVIAMHAVMAVAEAESDGSQAIDRMLTIARDETVAMNVRLTSLDALGPKVGTMDPREMGTLGEYLLTLSDNAARSGQLSAVDRQRMAMRIIMLRKLLAARKGR